jgi:hypothetical protein
MHGKTLTHMGDRMVYSFLLVALLSGRRSRSGRVKWMPIVRELRRVRNLSALLTVIGIGGFSVSLVRGIYTSRNGPLRPKAGAYHVFSPALTAADISYTYFLDKSA